ncbi:uncharacterized protein N7515_006928 [Penicillium bovifimosum]|uniref:Uncharacterized protein n=1 Tax=Penicillium bovifimosum TaxID=126998 RepID=A0A9W9GVL7_9EURO|nr:uncharacterized protein N7515_006928 [Penicillium bovifimosum]KAJ5130889.1 hypothetical protein N7515_006928 [Penicillium bovifimosum]
MDMRNVSKDRCQQSTKGMPFRAVSKWNQTDKLHRVARLEDSDEHALDQNPSSAPSPPRFYSRTSSNTKTESSSGPKSITTQSHLSPEQQIRGFYNAIVPVMSLVAQTKQLRNEKIASLGEIEDEWISSTIADAENAADDLSVLLKPFWVKQSNCNGWNRDHYNHASKKESWMLLCHSRVETVLGHLHALKVTSGSAVPSGTPVISEISSETQIVSVFEVPSTPATVEKAVPRIIVTQWDGEHDARMDQKDVRTEKRPTNDDIKIL